MSVTSDAVAARAAGTGAPADDHDEPVSGVDDRVRGAADRLAALLAEASAARVARAEAAGGDGGGAVCAWNHFENIPTFYNWNNRPR